MVWVGLIVFEILQRLYVRQASLKSLAILAASLILVIGGVLVALEYIMGAEVATFLFDRNLITTMQTISYPSIKANTTWGKTGTEMKGKAPTTAIRFIRWRWGRW